MPAAIIDATHGEGRLSPEDRGELSLTHVQLSAGESRDVSSSDHCDQRSTEKPRAAGQEHEDDTCVCICTNSLASYIEKYLRCLAVVHLGKPLNTHHVSL